MITDIYDDPNRELLRSKVASANLLEKYIDPPEKLAAYPDDVFALVMQDGDQTIRKFACVDKAQTGLSALYFQETWKTLPANAVKVAATNLSTAFGWYDMEVPEFLQKLSEWNPEHLTHLELEKRASAGKLYPYVNVTRHKTASAFADPEVVTAPNPAEIPKIASVEDLNDAVDHFIREAPQFNRLEKVAYCRHLVKAAQAVGVKSNRLPDSVIRWGTTKVASPDTIIDNLRRRSAILGQEKQAAYLRDAQIVLSSIKTDDFLDDAQQMVDKIASLDQHYGIDRYVAFEDPYQLVFDHQKVADYRWDDYRSGVRVTEDDLEKWASAEGLQKLAEVFNADVLAGFKQNPVEFFDALPQPMKMAMVKVAGLV